VLARDEEAMALLQGERAVDDEAELELQGHLELLAGNRAPLDEDLAESRLAPRGRRDPERLVEILLRRLSAAQEDPVEPVGRIVRAHEHGGALPQVDGERDAA